MRIHLPEKVIFTEAARPRCISLEMIDKSLCIPELKSITVLLYDFNYELNVSTFTLVVEVMFNLRTFSQVLATVCLLKYCNVIFCILKCI